MKIKNNCFLLLTSIVAGHAVLSLPSYAANLSFSSISLGINNFNIHPTGVGIVSDIDITTIADVGVVTANVQLNAMFVSEQTQAFAQSSSQTLIEGFGSQYFGRANINSFLVGNFTVNAQQDLSFDFQASLSLINSLENLDSGGSNAFGNVSLYLLNNLNQEVIDIFQVLANLNTLNDPVGTLSQDLLSIKTNPDIFFGNLSSAMISGDLYESTQVNLTGSFHKTFEQATSLTLVAVTQSCSRRSNVVGSCARIPEPSINVSFWLILIGLKIVLRLMK